MNTRTPITSPRRGVARQSTRSKCGRLIVRIEQGTGDLQGLGKGFEVVAPEPFAHPLDRAAPVEKEERRHGRQPELKRNGIGIGLEKDGKIEVQLPDEPLGDVRSVLEHGQGSTTPSAMDSVDVRERLTGRLAIPVADDHDARSSLVKGAVPPTKVREGHVWEVFADLQRQTVAPRRSKASRPSHGRLRESDFCTPKS
jgi:hypothetical protein